MNIFSKILELFGKKNKQSNTKPYVEEFTKCDKCKHLQECIKQGIVINNRTFDDNYEHYIVGIGGKCLIIEEQIIELFGKSIEEMTEEEIFTNLEKLKSMVGEV